MFRVFEVRNATRWIEFDGTGIFKSTTKFLPLPGGEGERKLKSRFRRGSGIIVIIIVIIRQLLGQ